MNQEVYDLAQKLGIEWCRMNYFHLIGAKKIGNHIYVMGYDYGFPHACATAKFDITTGEFVKMWDGDTCPITIAEGEYEECQ